MVLATRLAVTIEDRAAMEESAFLVFATTQDKTHADLLAVDFFSPGFVISFRNRGLLLVLRVLLGFLGRIARRGLCLVRIGSALRFRALRRSRGSSSRPGLEQSTDILTAEARFIHGIRQGPVMIPNQARYSSPDGLICREYFLQSRSPQSGVLVLRKGI